MDLRFQDGTSPFVFRETARRAATTDDPSVIVIQFRLAFLGSNPTLHAAFRREMRPAHAVICRVSGIPLETMGR